LNLSFLQANGAAALARNEEFLPICQHAVSGKKLVHGLNGRRPATSRRALAESHSGEDEASLGPYWRRRQNAFEMPRRKRTIVKNVN
jgi:hypothetical protein